MFRDGCGDRSDFVRLDAGVDVWFFLEKRRKSSHSGDSHDQHRQEDKHGAHTDQHQRRALFQQASVHFPIPAQFSYGSIANDISIDSADRRRKVARETYCSPAPMWRSTNSDIAPSAASRVSP